MPKLPDIPQIPESVEAVIGPLSFLGNDNSDGLAWWALALVSYS